jgi:hypothetical protein
MLCAAIASVKTDSSSYLPARESQPNPMTTDRNAHVFPNGIFCVLVFLACFWIAWPIAQMGFVDDWSYIKTAQVFAQTGQIQYNGWATAMLGWQIPWGALFIKLFGFSFMTVKLSTLPLALATLFLFHPILIRFGITSRNAVIGTLALGLSPIYMPLAASYMTDIPGLFVIVVCLYACQRAALSDTSQAAVGWLCLAAASNVAGGTARQVAWLGALVMVPTTGWLLRKKRGVFPASMAIWAVSTVCVWLCMRWFAHQPYSIEDPLIPHVDKRLLTPFLTVDRLGAEMLSLLICVYPILVAWLPKLSRKHVVSSISIASLIVLPMLAMYLKFHDAATLWAPHMLFKDLAIEKDGRINWAFDGQNSVLPLWVCVLISLLVLATLVGCIAIVWEKRRNVDRGSTPRLGRQIFWLCVPFALSYVALLIPRCCVGLSFDRYVLGLMPFVIIGLISLYQSCIGPNLPTVSAAVLVFYALLSIACTHDWFAWQRARLAAIGEVRSAGVPRTEIQGGFEYDGWTQIENDGYINEDRIQVPASAHKSNHNTLMNVVVACRDYFLPSIPAIHARFAIAAGPDWCFEDSKFPPVTYTAWLPPFKRTIDVRGPLSSTRAHYRSQTGDSR